MDAIIVGSIKTWSVNKFPFPLSPQALSSTPQDTLSQ